ncbi:zinc ABC transporter substrate-binding protein [Vallitalea pronyensis]|uniref:Zinc ABC transporter substrate-binding protein n=1 Tax=Vallitalea pronyensis TaxID=1348613 RepID=A0A8J8MIT3_9FIRM|nr:zinc ABC transporter substrate-binding protein [Vallitalea pronyensis]QUI22430.1 zinc ABC transporter substrate-binding protein [Vallitalea pronyensis]
MKKLIIGLVSLMLIVVMAGCSSNQKVKEEKDDTLNVVATTTMLKDLAIRIGGDKVNVVDLMGAGIDPHLYKASAGDVSKMQEADLIVYNGLHLEGKMGEIFENLQTRDKEVLAVGEALDETMLLSSSDFEGNQDPHIWFNVKLWMDVTRVLADKLIAIDEGNQTYYEDARDNYLKELENLDQYVTDRVNELEEDQRILITAHDAFNYFGDAYGFEVRGLQGISTSAEAGTQDVSQLADYITEKQIKAVFVESSVPVKNVEALKEAVASRGFEVAIGGELFSDSTGSAGTEEETFIGTMTHNINIIVDALK